MAAARRASEPSSTSPSDYQPAFAGALSGFAQQPGYGFPSPLRIANRHQQQRPPMSVKLAEQQAEPHDR